MGLTVDAAVQIGSAYWLRVPVDKLHNDRHIPLHPQLKALLDDWLVDRPPGLRSDLIFLDRGRPIPHARVDRALAKVVGLADIGPVTAHQLPHTLATQALNRGMSLEAIAALLGHRTMTMTMVYARIADRTVAEEYFAVSEKVETLYDHGAQLPADAEGAEMLKLRRQMHSRMLGNGHWARPVEMGSQRGQRDLTVVVDHASHQLLWVVPRARHRRLRRFFDALRHERPQNSRATS